MEFDKQGILNREKAAQQTAAVMDEGLRAYMLKVYNYMATGVLLTGIIALLSFKMSVVTDANGSIVSLTQFGSAIYMSGLKWIVMLAPLAIVFYMSFGINKMSASKAQTTFWVFAALMGLSSVIYFISLYGFKCNKSFLYLFSNFWCNEYLWLHN
jgi:FtsH-binding integral membrane protein